MTQEQALTVLKTGANVFLTGEPGAGKTYVINQYIKFAEACGLKVAVTASTGIAATHISGMTIHSWSGIGARDTLTSYDLDQITNTERIVKRMRNTHILVLDEISMLDGTLLDMVDLIAKTVRQSKEPFGGIQVVFVGDFFQLPPISRQGSMVRYSFESRAWENTRPLICYLSEQHRHADELLSGLLSAIRTNEVEEEHFTLLSEQNEIAYAEVEPTKLYTHNADVDSVNETHLKALSGHARRFSMSGKGQKNVQQTLMKSCLSPSVLELKEDAMVMCTKNNFEAGYVNGTLGRIRYFDADDGFPVIETANKSSIKITPSTWTVAEDKKVLAEIEQVPLRLAWAITIHKSQGMSLDAAEMDLSRAFAFGQGYVALSRVRTLAGLKVLGMSPTALRVDPKIVTADARFKTESELAEDTFIQMDADELQTLQRQFVESNGGTFVAGDVEEVAPSRAALQTESTYEATRKCLTQGLSVADIAKTRNLSTSTIWGHLDTLFQEGKLSKADIQHLCVPADTWDEIYTELETIFKEVGTDKLKPAFEASNEKYDYEIIRLARIVYHLS